MRYLAILAVVLMASPAFGIWTEDFSYPDGPLAGNDGWAGSGTQGYGSDITVENGVMKVVSASPGVAWGDHEWAWNTQPAETGSVVTVSMDIMAGGGGNSNHWYFYMGDLGNNYSLGYWYGGGGTAQSRGNTVVANTLSGPGIWDQLKAEVDFVNHETRFFFNGVHNHTIPHNGTPTGVALMEMQRYGRDDIPGQVVYFDNILIPEPAALSLLLLGLPFLHRRR